METELKKLAAAMRDMSDMVGDHHWQAAKAIEELDGLKSKRAEPGEKLSADGLEVVGYAVMRDGDASFPWLCKIHRVAEESASRVTLPPLATIEPLCRLTDAQRLLSQLREELAQRDAEVERLRRFEAAYIEWQEKTDWVQADAKPKELGKHRADVLRERIDALSVNHCKSGFCGDPYVHDCGRNDCPLSDSFKAPGK